MIDQKLLSVAAVSLPFVLNSTPVPGQTDDREPVGREAAIEEIVVTGTRIARLDYESASPLVTVDSSLFDRNGSPIVQTALNTLPQFTPWMTEYTNNRTGPNPPGQAIMDLRGLGLGRTLVLLDGQRVVPSNPYGSVDVNLIPPALVDTVEVITGGASAVYGSDAVAGVVNFKTRRFTGLQVDATWEQTDLGDGTGLYASLTGGREFSRGYAYGNLSFVDRDPVLQADRGFSEIATSYDPDVGEFVAFGSWAIREGRWDEYFDNLPPQAVVDAYFAAAVPGYIPGTVESNTGFGFNPDGTVFSIEPVVNFTGDMNDPLQPVEPLYYTYNYAPDNYLRVPMQRANFLGKAAVEVGRSSEAFAQVLWAAYTPDKQLAPTPLGAVWVGAHHPHASPEFEVLLASRPDPDALVPFAKRTIEVGPRRVEADYDVLQIVLGMNGDTGFSSDWKYRAYASWGQANSTDKLIGSVSRTAFEELSLAPDAGASICGGTGMNPFGIGSISPECAAYIRRDAIADTDVHQFVAEASLLGPLFELPAGQLRTAAGFLYMQNRFDFQPDNAYAARRIDPVFGYEIADVEGVGSGDPISGETESGELFIEANLPLLSDAPAAQQLEATIGFRYADHSNAGTITAWKAETIWQINDGVTFRSSYQQAVRAPDFVSLYSPVVSDFYSWEFRGEPCDSTFEPDDDLLGAQQDPDVAALCVAQGIPESELPNFVDSDRAGPGISGGNPDLAEETAETVTAGFVFRPTWPNAAGLRVSIDYYNIAVDDIVAWLGFPVYSCFDREVNPTLDPENIYCQRFSRDPVTYEIISIDDTAINLSQMGVSGFDLQMDMDFDLGPGQMHLHGIASYAESANQKEAPGSPTREFAGKATGSIVTAQSAFFSLVPRFKATADLDYVFGRFDTSLYWRYIGSMQDDWIEGFHLPSRQYVDLTIGVDMAGSNENGLQLRLGVTNLTNTAPVIYPSWIESNTEPSTYDVLGRRYYVSLRYRF